VVLESEDFSEAVEKYRALCREFWTKGLASGDPETRRRSAWGLIGLEPHHPAAGELLQQEGSPEDQKRQQQIRARARARNRGGRWGRQVH